MLRTKVGSTQPNAAAGVRAGWRQDERRAQRQMGPVDGKGAGRALAVAREDDVRRGVPS
jgi:hypothetical protein